MIHTGITHVWDEGIYPGHMPKFQEVGNIKKIQKSINIQISQPPTPFHKREMCPSRKVYFSMSNVDNAEEAKCKTISKYQEHNPFKVLNYIYPLPSL